MVNWKLLGISGATYLASLGIYDTLNSNKGYEGFEFGLKGGDKGLYHIVESARPLSDMTQKFVHTNGFNYNQPYLKDNSGYIATKVSDLTGIAQGAALGAGFLSLFGIGRRKKE